MNSDHYNLITSKKRHRIHNLISVDIAGGEDIQIDITDKTQQLPVSTGMAIGFLAATQDIVRARLDVDCGAPPGCARGYMYSVFAGALPATYAAGTLHQFASDGFWDGEANGREYAISALVEPGQVRGQVGLILYKSY